MSKTNTGLVAYAKAQLGLPYWFGCYGQVATEALYNQMKKLYPSYYTDSDFKSQYGKRVYDCSGLIKAYLWTTSTTGTPTYKAAQDKSAAGMYTAATNKGKISTFPKTVGLLLFRGTTAAKITHVGIYAGNNIVYEAKGHAYGVVQSEYNASNWNFWGQHSDITDDTGSENTENKSGEKAAADATADESATYSAIYAKIGNAYGACALMANWYAESALIANNLQNTYNTKLGMTDAEYTAAVDSGSYSKFETDSAGYGLAQWTYKTRKKALLAYAEAQNASIGNRAMQIAFGLQEIESDFPAVWKALKNATSVKEASDIVLTKYECPADQSDSVKTKRASYGEAYYKKYAGVTAAETVQAAESTVKEVTASAPAGSKQASLAGTYKVTAQSGLRLRDKPGTGSTLVTLPYGTKVQNYGYYSVYGSDKWLYIQVTYNGVKYTGHSSAAYLKKTS